MKNRVCPILIFCLLGCFCLLANQSDEPNRAVKLLFRQDDDGSLSFDTGVLKGKLHARGRSLGLTEVTHQPSGIRLDREPGLLDLYRLFSGSRRILPDVRSFPSQARITEDGAAEIHWEAAKDRPFERKALYQLIDPATIELKPKLSAHADLPAFEIFQSSYSSSLFSSARLYCRPLAQESTADAFLDRRSAQKNAKRNEQTRRLLLVTGQDYPGHLWRQTTPVVRSFLEQDSRLAVTVIEDPKLLGSTALDQYDTIVLHFMNWEQPAPGPEARERLCRRVSEGTGLALLHFACGAFQDWPEFAQLAGRVWDPKLRGHDPYRRFEVTFTDGEHPITRGLHAFSIVDELYTCLTGNKPIQILAEARSIVDGRDYPMAFIHQYGRGRVFHSVLGHDAQALRTPGAASLLRRGCAWTAGLVPQ